MVAGVVAEHTVARWCLPAAASTDCSSKPSPASGQGSGQQPAGWPPQSVEVAVVAAVGRTGQLQMPDHTYQLAAVSAGHTC